MTNRTTEYWPSRIHATEASNTATEEIEIIGRPPLAPGSDFMYCSLSGCNMQRLGPNGGAAGVLLVRRDRGGANSSPTHVVLHQRDDTTWALPGGVIDFGETPREAAFREASEEARLPRDCRDGDNPLVVVADEVVTYDHGAWKYTVIIGDVMTDWIPKRRIGDFEILAVRWVSVGEVAGKNLHRDFKTQWPALLDAIQTRQLVSNSSESIGADPYVKDVVEREMSLTASDAQIERSLQTLPALPSTAAPSTNEELLENRYQTNIAVRMNISKIKEAARLERYRD